MGKNKINELIPLNIKWCSSQYRPALLCSGLRRTERLGVAAESGQTSAVAVDWYSSTRLPVVPGPVEMELGKSELDVAPGKGCLGVEYHYE